MAELTPDGDVGIEDGEFAADDASIAAEENTVARLMGVAGRRPPVPTDVLAELRRNTHDHWRQKIVRQQLVRRQRLRWLAVAATLVVAISGSLLWRGQQSVSSPIAMTPIADLETVVGGNWEFPADGLVEGAILETGDVRVALRMNTGASLRLDVDTRMVLRRSDLVALERGAVYIDTETKGTPDGTSLAVQSPLGLARDIGTQFEVRLSSDNLEVRVREGEVQVETADGKHAALAGSSLRITADGSVERYDEAAYGSSWDWVLAAAPAIDLEGQSLAEALRWMVRETGWQVAYEDEALEIQVESIIVHGAVQDLRPDEVAEVLLPGSGLSSVLRDGALLVQRLGAEKSVVR